MIKYLEYSDWSNLRFYILKETNQENYFFESNSSLGKNLERSRVFTSSELFLEIEKSEDIFETESFEKNLLIDIQDLKFDNKITDNLTEVIKNEEENRQVFLYSTSKDSLSADEKKNFKKAKIEILDTDKLLKEDEILEIAKKYTEHQKLSLKNSDIQTIVKNQKKLSDILNTLDFIDLVDENNRAKILNDLFNQTEILPFMLPFRMNNLKDDTKKWYKRISEESLQLDLSLVFGKLDKQTNLDNSREILKDLILTDKQIKNRGKIKPTLWWKLFLWKAKQV